MTEKLKWILLIPILIRVYQEYISSGLGEAVVLASLFVVVLLAFSHGDK